MYFVHAGQETRRGFTLVELLVVIAIVIILMALLLPSIGSMMAGRTQTECANRLKQIFVAIQRAESDGPQVLSNSWIDSITSYVGDRDQVLFCPDDINTDEQSSFGMNTRAHRLGDRDGSRIEMLDYQQVEATLVVNDLSDQDDWSADQGQYAARHLHGVNALLHTGAVKTYQAEEIDPRDCELWKRFWRPHQDHQFELDECGTEEEAVEEPITEEQDPPVDADPKYPEYDGVTCARTDPQTIDDQDTEGFRLEKDGTPDFYFWGTYIFSSGWKSIGGIEEATGAVWSWKMHHDKHTLAPGHQTDQTRAVYEFDVEPGNKYRVYAFWLGEGHPTYDPQGRGRQLYGHSDSTPFRVFDGDEEIYIERVDQKIGSEGAKFDYPVTYGNGKRTENWYPIGDEFEITSGKLTVTIAADAGATNQFGEAQYSNVVADAVRVECSQQWPYYSDGCEGVQPRTVDDGGGGFQAEGDWTELSEEDAEGGSHQIALPGNGEKKATYDFGELRGGQYTVWTQFVAKENQASDAPFEVYDGDHKFPTVYVDQSVGYLGSDLDKDGRRWYKVGEFEMREHGQIRVVLSNESDGIVVADAVRIQCAFSSESDCDGTSSIYGRSCRQEYAEDYGATDETEEAVANGLNWLSRHQYEGGHWSYDHSQATCPYIDPPEPCGGACGNSGGKTEYDVAATGMALLPFLGAGFGPEHDRYGQVVTYGVNYLIDHVATGDSATGRVATTGGLHYQGYEHGIGTLALVEALGVCRQGGFGDIDEQELTMAVQLALKRIVTCQGPTSGGWRYACASSHDLTVTSWMVQSLIAADALGIDYEAFDDNRSVMREAKAYLNHNSSDVVPDSSYGDYAKHYWYQRWWNPWGMGPQMGKFLQISLGAPPQAAGMQAAADDELTRVASGAGIGKDAYQAYYAHHFMRQVGGQHWETWDAQMKEYLLDNIRPPEEGHERGSWLRSEGSRIHGECGRLWDTVSASLCLEAYYRYSNSL